MESRNSKLFLDNHFVLGITYNKKLALLTFYCQES